MTTLYKILSYLLLPVGALFGVLTLLMLLASLGNLAALLPVFLVGATVIYIFASFLFLHRGLQGGQPLRPSLRDWIRVNSFVALFFAISCLAQGMYLLGNKEMMEQLRTQVEQMAGEMSAGPMPDAMKLIRSVLLFMMALGGVLLVHILIGMRLLRQYAGLFQPPPKSL